MRSCIAYSLLLSFLVNPTSNHAIFVSNAISTLRLAFGLTFTPGAYFILNRLVISFCKQRASCSPASWFAGSVLGLVVTDTMGFFAYSSGTCALMFANTIFSVLLHRSFNRRAICLLPDVVPEIPVIFMSRWSD